MAPSQPREALRPLQVLENLLAPFAGDRSQRISERLIARFGSPAGVIAASRSQLDEAGGEDRDICALIDAARTLVETSLREDLRSTQVSLRDSRLKRYLQVHLGKRDHECLYAIFVDRNHCYLKGEEISSGSRTGIEARFGHLFRRAVELRAEGLILAHNHPSGDHRPSRKDIVATKAMDETASRLDLVLHDHLIVTATHVYSIKQGLTL